MTADIADLATRRNSIDEIDANIIALICKRFGVTTEVGILKAKFALDATDPGWEANQRKRYADLAAKHNLSEELIQTIFRAVIDKVVSNHKVVANISPR